MAFPILLEVKEHQYVQSLTSVSYLEEKQRLFLLLYNLLKNQPINLIDIWIEDVMKLWRYWQIICFKVYVVVNFYFQLKFSFPLFLCMLMYGNAHKNKGKLKFRKKINFNIYRNLQNYLLIILLLDKSKQEKRGNNQGKKLRKCELNFFNTLVDSSNFNKSWRSPIKA